MSTILDAIYLIIMIAISPWIAWRYFVQKKNRRGWGQKLFGWGPIRNSDNPCVWIHAVSVGEVNLLAPLVAELCRRYPNLDIAISTTTETGFDLAMQKYPEQTVFFCPSDFSWAIRNTIHRLKPDLLLLTELELWPNLITQTRLKNIPVALINGRISEKSFRGYQRLRSLFSPLLNQLNLAIVQTPDYADRLIGLGISAAKVAVSGNLKFDGLSNTRTVSTIDSVVAKAGIQKEQFVFVAGSTQENEDRMAISVFEKLKPHFPRLRMILVPRHPERARRLAHFLAEKSIPVMFRSESNIEVPDSPVVVVDVIGELQQWWGKADLGYVGGSMGGRGGQNMIEPAAFGVPVCFGPFTENFKDVVDLLLANKAAHVVRNAAELESLLRLAIAGDDSITAMAARGEKLIQSQQGSTLQIANLLAPILNALHSIEIAAVKAA